MSSPFVVCLCEKRLRELVAASVLHVIERQKQERSPVGRHPRTCVPQLVEGVGVTILGLLAGSLVALLALILNRFPFWLGAPQYIREIRLQVRFGSRIVGIHTGKRPRAIRNPVLIDLIAGASGLDEPVERIRRHERVVLIRLPPSPTAIVVLQIDQPSDAGVGLAVEHRESFRWHQLQLAERSGDDDIGEEARDRLFGTAVRIAREKVECAKK